MHFGTGFPLTAADNPRTACDFARALDAAGFDFVTTAGHLLSAEAGRYPERPNATYAGPFYEPFVLFSYLAAITERLVFRPNILILPLFPTALVARQAAELSWLSGSRFELGAGLSWQAAEYQALNQDLHTRGRRLEEQITLLRRLWTEPFVSFEGRWHHFDRVGLNRLPAKPIPIWIGSGTDERSLRRVAKLADGWSPLGDPAEGMERLRQYLAEEGRDPFGFSLTGRITAGSEGPAAWLQAAQRLQGLGTTHLLIGAPPELPPEQALARIVEVRQALAAEFGEDRG